MTQTIAKLSNVSLNQLKIIAQTISSTLQAGDIVLLYGDLGAGKTTLSRYIIQALTTADETVPSPTYTLAQTYELPNGSNLWHFDFYRIDHADEALEIGIEEAFSKGISLIEWPEKIQEHLPNNCLEIHLEFDNQKEYRTIKIRTEDEASSRWDDLQRSVCAATNN